MRRFLTMTLAAGAVCGAVFSARNSAGQQPPSRSANSPATQSGGAPDPLRSITLPVMDSPLPEAPGKQTCQIACTICHSARYITLQPPFSRKAWSDEVQKMIKNYGAPVTGPQAEEIVNYLVAIRGVK
jgi:hypothetical protein